MVNRFRRLIPHRAVPLTAVAFLAIIAQGTTMRPAAQEPAAMSSGLIEFPCPSNPSLTCVMSGLDNPRGMAFGPQGALYVAEAGRGPAVHVCFDDPSQAACICPTCFLNPTPEDIQQHTCLKRAGGQTVCSGP